MKIYTHIAVKRIVLFRSILRLYAKIKEFQRQILTLYGSNTRKYNTASIVRVTLSEKVRKCMKRNKRRVTKNKGKQNKQSL